MVSKFFSDTGSFYRPNNKKGKISSDYEKLLQWFCISNFDKKTFLQSFGSIYIYCGNLQTRKKIHILVCIIQQR